MRRLLNRRWVRELSWLFLILCVAAVAAPIVSRREAQRRLAAGQSNLSACQGNLKNIGTALEMYSTDNGGRFPYFGDPPLPHGALPWLVPQYPRTLPTCPAAGHDTYSESYVASVSPDGYIIECRGTWHSDTGVERDLPRYTSHTGLTSMRAEGGNTVCASRASVTHLPRDLRVCGVACGMSADEVEAVGRRRRGRPSYRPSHTYPHEADDHHHCTVSFDRAGRVRSVQGCTVSFGGHAWDLPHREPRLDLLQSLGAPTAVLRGSQFEAADIIPSVRGRWRYTDANQNLSLVLYGEGEHSFGWAELRCEP